MNGIRTVTETATEFLNQHKDENKVETLKNGENESRRKGQEQEQEQDLD